MSDTPALGPAPQNTIIQREVSRPPRRERSPVQPEASRPSFAERQAALGTPLQSTPDYPDQIRVLFLDHKTKEAIQLHRGQLKVSAKQSPARIPAAHLPRKGDQIEAGGFIFNVEAVLWTYSVTGEPLVKLAVACIAKT